MRESQVQRDVKRAYEKAGCFVAVFSQGRKTRQTPGIPDLLIFVPGRFLPWWHETKAPGGKQSPAQVTWQARCETVGMSYVLGGLPEALAHLKLVGLMR